MKIITAPRTLSGTEKEVRLAEIKIQRIYALGDILTLRQRSSIIRALLLRLVFSKSQQEFDEDAATST